MPDDKLLQGLEKGDASFEAEPAIPKKVDEAFDGQNFEKPATPENQEGAFGAGFDKKPEIEQIGEANRGIVAAGNAAGASQARKKEIERILEAGLEDIFAGLPPEKKTEFVRAGEETAGRINELFDTAKVRAKKIIVLIKKWLLILPGINKFFLEQEAKIKTDEIIKLNKTF